MQQTLAQAQVVRLDHICRKLQVSTMLHDMARADWGMEDTKNLRPSCARTLWAWSDRLEAQLPAARDVLRAQPITDQGNKVVACVPRLSGGQCLGA
ncbi:MAG: hypothetical protein ACK41V_18815 [Acidovorax sp.]|uniref:hypothetical protein n=1 Tax=Acidovorax sp. TaxID=1872122 RepID=UPI003918F712